MQSKDLAFVNDSSDKLLSDECIFPNKRCNFQEHNIITMNVNDADYCIVYETATTLQELKNSGVWKNGAICDAIVPIITRLFLYHGTFNHFIFLNRHENDFFRCNSTLRSMIYRRLLISECCLSVAVNDESGNFMTEPMHLKMPSNANFITNIDTHTNITDKEFDIQEKMAQYEVTSDDSVAPDSSVIVNVKSLLNGEEVNYDHEIDVRMISGYAVTSRVLLKNGFGSFKVMALGLNPGDSVKFFIKNNERVCAEHVIPVV